MRTEPAAPAAAPATWRPGYLPWPFPAAAGVVAGIVAAYAGVHVAWLVPACALVGRWRLAFGVVLVAFFALGWVRMASWVAAPDPLAHLVGREVALAGSTDGDVLALDEPPGARVALAGEDVPAGRVRVQGLLLAPEGRRNPGGFDDRGYLRRRGITARLVVGEVLAAAPRPDPAGRLHEAAARGLGEREAALVAAMTLGVRDDLGALRDAFAAAGLAHVLALSGLHVGVLMATVAWMLRRLGRARFGVMLVVLACFVALVGPTPSVVRAALMIGAALVSLWYGAGRLEPWTTLALAGTLTLVWSPSWLFDLSFQLSYLAVAGLLAFAGPGLRALRADAAPWWHPRTLVLGSAVLAVASQVPTSSLLVDAFGRIPLLSPVANVLGMPLATLLVPLGFAAAVIGSIAPPLGAALGSVTGPVAALLIVVAERAAEWPMLVWGEIGPRGHAVYATAVVALAMAVRGWLAPRRTLLVLAVCLGYAALPADLPEIVWIDVGQGDATLVRLPGRREVLIDGGGTPFSDFDVGGAVVVPALRALGVDELELVVATHADTDHMEGLAAVLRAVPVGTLVVGRDAAGAPVYDELMAVADERGVPVARVSRGQRVRLGDATFDVLHPAARSRGAANEDSVALVFRWRDRPVALFLGDVSHGIEATLAVPPTPILMAAHHGSPHSTSAALLEAARPDVAVISVGRNRYGHPSPDVIARLRDAGAAVRTTQTEGAVRIAVSDVLLP